MKLHLLLTTLVSTAVFITALNAGEKDPTTADPKRADAATAAGANPNSAPDEAVKKADSATEGSRHTDDESIRTAEHRRASKIIGMDIVNREDEKVGSVHDLAVDLSSGRVTAVIISSGGFLGIADELSIVPPSALTLSEKGDAFSANLTKEQLTDAPRFQGSKYPDLNDQKYMLNVYTTYDAEPYLESTRTADANADGGRRVLKASEILGMDVKNHEDESIGDINELVLNHSMDRISSVVVSSGGFLGIGNTLSVLPAEAVTTTKDAVLVNATKTTLERSPRFSEEAWPERMNDPSYLVNIYSPYQFNDEVKTDVDVNANTDEKVADADKTAVRENKEPGALTAQDQSNAPGDIDATTMIRRKIVSHDDLSFSAKNIRVITVDGKVTLAGQVASEQEIETIMKIAREETGESTITNRLSVKN